jgi:hypothetical protein
LKLTSVFILDAKAGAPSLPTPTAGLSLPPSLPPSQAAVLEKLARNLTVADLPYLEGIIQRKMYDPTYVPLVNQPH